MASVSGTRPPTQIPKIRQMNALANKVAIVTCASTGIGSATARMFAQQGAAVVVAARRLQELDALVESIAADGGLDIAFNNAGILGNMGPVPGMSQTDWDLVIATNLTGAFLGAKYQLPAMAARGGGSVIFTSTFVGYRVRRCWWTAAFPSIESERP